MSYPSKKFTEEECALFNKLREERKGKVLSFSTILDLFKANFKNGTRVLQKLVIEKIIIKVGRGKYQFPEQPVYYKVLQAAWENKKEIVKKQPKVKTLEDEIEDAILFLSDNGYRILKRVFNVEAAMKSPEKSVASFITWEEVI